MGWSQRPTGLTLYQPTSTYRGYTLFSPNGGTEAYLVDMEGHFVHRWRHDAGIGYGFLLPNGNFLFRDSGGLSAMPGANAVRELNWDGDLVWEYRNPAVRRHNRLANGNNLFLLYEEISEELSRRVQGGFTTPTDPPRMQGDLVAEVTPDGEVVYEWRSSEHLDTAEDMICPLEGRASWGAANDLTALDDGNFLISFRSLSSVALVLSQLGFGMCLRKGTIELSCLVESVDGGGGSDGQGQIRSAAGAGTTGRTPAFDSGGEKLRPSGR